MGKINIEFRPKSSQSTTGCVKQGVCEKNLTIDTCPLKDEQNMGIHLQGLAMKTDTHGQYQRLGEVYGFLISHL